MDEFVGGPTVDVVGGEGADPDSVRELIALVERAASSLGRASLSGHKRMELDHLVRPSDEPSVGHPPDPVALVARSPSGGAPVGYAHLSVGPGSARYAVEVVLDPLRAAIPGPGDAVADALLEAACSAVAGRGGGTLRLWAASAGDADDARARRHAFEPERDLMQMRCALPRPLPASSTGSPSVETRAFRPGLDEQAWLTTNNRSFVDHPEQGHWTLAGLLELEKEPWFDPEGLLLFEHQGRLAGSCWTKVHRDTDPPMGEIYVIGVDPDFHGRGWGRALTGAGLDWLAAKGLTVGMLYVDAGNRAAVSLYRSMGFGTHHIDRAYLRQVDPL